ncbi:hypothetical protein GCM10011521_15090 [Arenimonas soli]|uniref:Uncharacterized protein n=1 Tax=Arenimonas soli TaxID=2269504 RepID=A0ABQ1HJ53_9GAMM|nr:hypothetical protein [Arenimonas soli]GGA77732.1 hypothetical protein GCM10011521_15090 [Arenimonas soli]
MDILVNVLVQYRQLMLRRQAAAVLKAVRALDATQRKTTADQTLSEIQAASVLPYPHWHGSNESMLYRPWSPVASVASGRVRDRSVQLRQRSVAVWLAVVYHETRQSPHAGLQAVHRQVLGILRELRESSQASPAAEQAWFKAAA